MKTFGATPGIRWRYMAADLPGINMNFSDQKDQKQPFAPTRGRMLDHIGFEVKDLSAFCRRLEAAGVKFDAPYAKDGSGVARAMLTDPWGTSIELDRRPERKFKVVTSNFRFRGLWRGRALVGRRHRRDPFVQESLHALALVGLRRVEVAFESAATPWTA